MAEWDMFDMFFIKAILAKINDGPMNREEITEFFGKLEIDPQELREQRQSSVNN